MMKKVDQVRNCRERIRIRCEYLKFLAGTSLFVTLAKKIVAEEIEAAWKADGTVKLNENVELLRVLARAKAFLITLRINDGEEEFLHRFHELDQAMKHVLDNLADGPDGEIDMEKLENDVRKAYAELEPNVKRTKARIRIAVATVCTWIAFRIRKEREKRNLPFYTENSLWQDADLSLLPERGRQRKNRGGRKSVTKEEFEKITRKKIIHFLLNNKILPEDEMEAKKMVDMIFGVIKALNEWKAGSQNKPVLKRVSLDTLEKLMDFENVDVRRIKLMVKCISSVMDRIQSLFESIKKKVDDKEALLKCKEVLGHFVYRFDANTTLSVEEQWEMISKVLRLAGENAERVFGVSDYARDEWFVKKNGDLGCPPKLCAMETLKIFLYYVMFPDRSLKGVAADFSKMGRLHPFFTIETQVSAPTLCRHFARLGPMTVRNLFCLLAEKLCPEGARILVADGTSLVPRLRDLGTGDSRGSNGGPTFSLISDARSRYVLFAVVGHSNVGEPTRILMFDRKIDSKLAGSLLVADTAFNNRNGRSVLEGQALLLNSPVGTNYRPDYPTDGSSEDVQGWSQYLLAVYVLSSLFNAEFTPKDLENRKIRTSLMDLGRKLWCNLSGYFIRNCSESINEEAKHRLGGQVLMKTDPMKFMFGFGWVLCHNLLRIGRCKQAQDTCVVNGRDNRPIEERPLICGHVAGSGIRLFDFSRGVYR